MMNKKNLTIFILSIMLIFIILTLTIMLTVSKLKYVEIRKSESNFYVNNDELVKYLGLKKNKSLFFYDYGGIRKKLLNIYFVDDARINLVMPSKIIIKLKIREPLAFITGNNGRLYTVDREGMVYNNYNHGMNIPLLISDYSDKIITGKTVPSDYKKVIDFLYYLKDNQKVLFDSLSQIEILKKNKDGSIIVNFRTYRPRIYLKNLINVDVIRRGLALVIFLDKMKISADKAVYTETGFIIK